MSNSRVDANVNEIVDAALNNAESILAELKKEIQQIDVVINNQKELIEKDNKLASELLLNNSASRDKITGRLTDKVRQITDTQAKSNIKVWKEIFQVARYVIGDTHQRFTNDIIKRFEKFSSYTPQFLKIAATISQRFANHEEYCKMVDYFLSKGPAGAGVAKHIIEQSLQSCKEVISSATATPSEKKANQYRLDRDLMLAAKMGDLTLYSNLIAAGARYIDPHTKQLITDKTGKSVLFYACQGSKAELVKNIVDEMKEAHTKGNFRAPRDSIDAGGVFNPFRIRDDKSIGAIYLNELCPLDFVTPQFAVELDKEFKLSDECAKNTFKAAVAYRIINHKVTGQGMRFLADKLGAHAENFELALYGGKFFAGTAVANIAEEAATAAANFIESGVFIGVAAGATAGVLAIRNIKKAHEAIKNTGANEFVRLPNENGTPVADYNGKENNNHDIQEALRVRDFEYLKKVVSDPTSFRKTTAEIITLVKQIIVYPSDFNKEAFFTTLAEKCSDKKQLEVLIEALYHREENDIALKIVKIAQSKVPKTLEKINPLSAHLTDQRISELAYKITQQKHPHHAAKGEFKEEVATNKELIEAFEKDDYFKIQHIISHGDFSHASKDLIEAFKEMAFVPPGKLPPKDRTFMQIVYEGLAQKAGPTELKLLLEDCIKSTGSTFTDTVIKNLIQQYNHAPDSPEEQRHNTERFKVFAQIAATTGNTENLHAALTALREQCNIHDVLSILDKEGNTILHLAATSQHADTVKFILQSTSILNDFITAGRSTKEENVLLGLVTIRTAKTIMEMPNKNGEIPAKMLQEESAKAKMDDYFKTVGFRLDNNASYVMEDKQRKDRVRLAANITSATATLLFCTGLAIPLFTDLGEGLGKIIASATVHIFKSISFGGGVAEGGFACFAAKIAETKLMPGTRDVFQSFGKVWNKYRNNSYMRTIRDFDNQQILKSDELMQSIANRMAQLGPEPKLTEWGKIFREEVAGMVAREIDPDMRLIAQRAAENVLSTLVGTIQDPNKGPDKVFETVMAAAKEIDEKNNVVSAIEKLQDAKTNYHNAVKNIIAIPDGRFERLTDVVTSAVSKLNTEMNYHIQQLIQLEEHCVSQGELQAAQQANPNAKPDQVFIIAAYARVDNDTIRQKQALGKDPTSAQLQKIDGQAQKKKNYITNLAISHEQMLQERDSKLYSRLNPTIAFDMLAKTLRELDGGCNGWKSESKRSNLPWRDGPLTDAVKKIMHEQGTPQTLEKLIQACEKAYRDEVKFPQPAGVMQMRQAIEAYWDQLQYLKGAPRVTMTQQQVASATVAMQAPSPQSAVVEPIKPSAQAHPALTLQATASATNRNRSEIKSIPLDEPSQANAQKLGVECVATLLKSVNESKYAKEILASMGVIQVTRDSQNKPQAITITKEWQSLVNHPATFDYNEKIRVPETLEQLHQHDNSVIAPKAETQTIPNQAKYNHKDSQANFEVSKGANGYDFTTTKVPAPDKLLAYIHEQLQFYCEHNGAQRPIRIDGTDRELIAATIQVCKAYNLEYTLAPELLGGLKNQPLADAINLINGLSNDIADAAKKQDYIACYTAHTMSTETAKIQCSGLPPLLTAVKLDNHAELAGKMSNDTVRTIAENFAAGAKVSHETIASLGKSIQSTIANKQLVANQQSNNEIKIEAVSSLRRS